MEGVAGSGKSTLMRFIYTHTKFRDLLPENAVVIAHHFWLSGSDNPEHSVRRSFQGLLLNLAYQLLDHLADTDLPADESFRRRISRHKKYTDWSEADLRELLKSGVTALKDTDRRCVMFVDALDEFDPASAPFPRPLGVTGILDLLQSLLDISQGQVLSVCVSTRPDNWLQHPFFTTCSRLRLQDLTSRDIEKYADHELSNYTLSYSGFSEWQKNELLLGIQSKAEGNFFWVAMALQSLRLAMENIQPFEKVVASLNELPTRIEELFELMLQRRANDSDELRKESAEYLFMGIHANKTIMPFEEFVLTMEVSVDDQDEMIAKGLDFGDPSFQEKLAFTRRKLLARTAGIMIFSKTLEERQKSLDERNYRFDSEPDEIRVMMDDFGGVMLDDSGDTIAIESGRDIANESECDIADEFHSGIEPVLQPEYSGVIEYVHRSAYQFLTGTKFGQTRLEMSPVSLCKLLKQRLQAAATYSLLAKGEFNEAVDEAYSAMFTVVRAMEDLIPRHTNNLRDTYMEVLTNVWDRLNVLSGELGRGRFTWTMLVLRPRPYDTRRQDVVIKSTVEVLSMQSLKMDPTSRSQAICTLLAFIADHETRAYHYETYLFLDMINDLLTMELDLSKQRPQIQYAESWLNIFRTSTPLPPTSFDAVKISLLSVVDRILCYIIWDLCNFKRCFTLPRNRSAALEMLNKLQSFINASQPSVMVNMMFQLMEAGDHAFPRQCVIVWSRVDIEELCHTFKNVMADLALTPDDKAILSQYRLPTGRYSDQFAFLFKDIRIVSVLEETWHGSGWLVQELINFVPDEHAAKFVAEVCSSSIWIRIAPCLSYDRTVGSSSLQWHEGTGRFISLCTNLSLKGAYVENDQDRFRFRWWSSESIRETFETESLGMYEITLASAERLFGRVISHFSRKKRSMHSKHEHGFLTPYCRAHMDSGNVSDLIVVDLINRPWPKSVISTSDFSLD